MQVALTSCSANDLSASKCTRDNVTVGHLNQFTQMSSDKDTLLSMGFDPARVECTQNSITSFLVSPTYAIELQGHSRPLPIAVFSRQWTIY